MPYKAPEWEAQAGSWRLLSELARLPARVVPFSGLSGGAQLYSGRCILTGAIIHNANAGSVVMVLRDGLDATGDKLDQASLATAASHSPSLPAQGVVCERGVFLDIAAGPLDGSIFVVPLWHYRFTPPGE